MRASGSIPGGSQGPLNTDRTCISNRFQPATSANHVEIRRDAGNFNKFLELGDLDGLQRTVGNQAAVLYARGDLDGAMALWKVQERTCRELGNKDGLQLTLGNQASILKARGELDGAMALHKEEERICRELGNQDGLQRTLGNQANILWDRGDLDGATILHEEEERICRQLGDKAGLSSSIGNQALILDARGDLDGAIELLMEQERLCRELSNPKGLSISLSNQAYLLKDLPGRRGEARGLAEEALSIATRHSYQQLVPRFERIRDSILADKASPVDYPSESEARRIEAWAAPSIPHPSADGARAAQLNIEYQKAKKAWEALPWWKRMRTTRPEPPTGI